MGQDDWTTLPDLNGHTQATGESCPSGWNTLHPFLDHYQTRRSGDLHPNRHDRRMERGVGRLGRLAAVAGEPRRVRAASQVEVSISYVSDWATQGLGVFVDDVTYPDGTSTSFESGLDGWAVPGSPAGSAANANDFEAIGAAGFPEGAVVATNDSLYMGFGFEGISTPASRNEIMGRAMGYLLRP